jgi:predicted dehydrogenase
MSNGIDRREFLKGAAATVALMITAEQIAKAEGAADAPAVTGPAVKFGIIGMGPWGREILTALSKMPSAQITAICDTYEPYVGKGKEIAPNAATFADYRKLLESAEVEAVVIATPSHLHKEISLAAIQAGKHVYLEAPIAHTVEEAKIIALAGKGSSKIFQAGLQGRSNLLYTHVGKFVKTGVLGTPVEVVAQWNKKDSWRRMASTPEREKELNWRLSKATSPGLVGEAGVHHIDLANWFLNGLPVAVTGFSGIIGWNDGRDVPDTVQAVIEYPNSVRMTFTSTLSSSFSNSFTTVQGNNATLLMREKKGWMIKEADSQMLGWEGYARKEPTNDEIGICMVADASKILAAGKEPGKEGSIEPTKEALYCALENFTRSIREGAKVSADALAGYQATVIALKANEAALTGSKIAYQPDWFTL